jgi:glycosyltransferase involved in cell wall biosynthesis
MKRSAPHAAIRVLIPFGTPFLYGMERTVIEVFDALRPQVDPEFLLSTMAARRRAPVVLEIERRQLRHSFLPDRRDWPRLAKPRSLRQAWNLLVALVLGNISTLKAAFRCDLLYICSSIGLSSLLAAMYCRLVGRRVIYHFHDLQPHRALIRLWGALASDFVHNTDFSRQYVVERHPFLRRESHAVLPPISECRPCAPLASELESQFAGKRNVVFVGQVSAHKGVDLLLEAYRLVAGACPDTRLHIVGGCTEAFQPEFDALLARSNGSVKVWGYRENSLEWIRRAYVYVHPSRPSCCQEAFGRGAVEAMAAGVPCVCFRSGSLQEIVMPLETGLICESETVACLADGIQRFLDDPGLRDACGQAARARFEERYSCAIVRRRWLEYFGALSSAER